MAGSRKPSQLDIRSYVAQQYEQTYEQVNLSSNHYFSAKPSLNWTYCHAACLISTT